jgi:heme/copper-type cytochrome/quinol oxidase subunit 2
VTSADNAEMCGELFSDMDGTVYLESSDSDKLWFNSHTQMVMYHLQEDVK